MSSLYLHIPFCEHKCIYCDFYSVAPNGNKEKSSARLRRAQSSRSVERSDEPFDSLVDRFLVALRTEIELRHADGRYDAEYSTIFFGGGTPSLLPPSNVGEILDLLHAKFRVRSDAEITLETNPGTVTLKTLRELRKVGVNRISMGIQSFHDDDLKFLSRIHTAEQAKSCVRDAFRAGFENVSFDLIFSLPSQSLERWESNLQQAVALEPSHISCYSLIVEPDTPLYKMVESKQISPLPENVDAKMYETTIAFLRTHGYEQYEVSNFARPGFKSRHNLSYWNHDQYLGFGPSAHSFWDGRRFWNIANIVNYTEFLNRGQLPEAGGEELTEEQLLEEEIFLGLRSEGIDLKKFRRLYRKDLLESASTRVRDFLQDDLLVLDRERLRLTSKGYLLCDEIASTLVLAGMPGEMYYK